MGRPEPKAAVGFRNFIATFLTSMVLVVVLLTCLLVLKEEEDYSRMSCPDNRPRLHSFPTEKLDVTLGNGTSYLISKSFTGNYLRITDGATLIVADTDMTLTFNYILIDGGGSLLIGSESCPFKSKINIVLKGTSDDPYEIPTFGRKFIGVGVAGSLEIHGIKDKLSWTYLSKSLKPTAGQESVIELEDAARGWQVGDSIVIASTDYEMDHSEVFQIVACQNCTSNQVKIKGSVKYTHLSEMIENQVAMRAEVGILTRNIKISGVQNSCTSQCTFGGQIKVVGNSKSFRLEGAELESMGQASVDSRHPVTFHRVGDARNYYVKQLSIHKSYSRCIALEATQNTLVEDVVAYDVLGHCFYMSEGTEQNNTLRHNLGLVTRSSTLTPAERNTANCLLLSSNYSGHVPDVDKECNGVSTFFVTHPNNFLEDNSAAGSESNGFLYAFSRQPLYMSLSPYAAERSLLGSFENNRAHSNMKAGLSLGRGIKLTPPTAENPQDFRSLNDDARFAPQLNENSSDTRKSAKIVSFTSYCNNLGLFARGGDILVQDSKFADNDVGVILSSSDTLPYARGSQQRLERSFIIGQSRMNDNAWLKRSVPAFGVQLNNGPVLIDDVHFRNFINTTNFNTTGRESYAIGFVPNNIGQLSVKNTIGLCQFMNVDRKIYLGRSNSSYWGNNDKDGDLFQIVQDQSGSITGLSGSYIIRSDNPLLVKDSCQTKIDQQITFCPKSSYGQLFLNANTKRATLNVIVPSALESGFVSLSGVDKTDQTKPNSTQYQSTLEAKRQYRMHWTGDKVPSKIELSMFNFDKNDYLYVELCYPPNTTFTVSDRKWDEATGNVLETLDIYEESNLSDLQQSSFNAYFWDSTTRLLNMKLVNDGQAFNSNYCADDGCRTIVIDAVVTTDSEYFDCLF